MKNLRLFVRLEWPIILAAVFVLIAALTRGHRDHGQVLHRADQFCVQHSKYDTEQTECRETWLSSAIKTAKTNYAINQAKARADVK